MTDTTWTPEELSLAKTRLGITPEATAPLRAARTQAAAQEALDDIKGDVKKRYRQWAQTLHPDKVDAGPHAQAQLQCLSFLWAQLRGLTLQKIQKVRPQVRRTVIVVHTVYGFGTSSGTNTGSTTFNGGWA